MKSRLLPPPTTEQDESEYDSPASTPQARREADEPQAKTEAQSRASASTPATQPEPYAPPPTAPQVSARPQGRLVVAGILLVCVTSVGYLLWSTFLRDAAYGVVVGQVTAISPPWPGTLTAIHIAPGDKVRQGDVLAVVEDPDLQASIDRLSDDLRTAQAQLDAQVALLALAAHQRGSDSEAIRADYYDQRGELLIEQARYQQLSSRLARRQELAGRRAISSEEVETLQFEKSGLAAKIENRQQAVAALEKQLAQLPGLQHHDTAQLQPQLARIENYQSEINRLREKQRRGTLRAPVPGTVVEVVGQLGERASLEQPVLELLPAGSLKLVLYVKQNQVGAYQVGQTTELIVDPNPESITCRVTRLGKRFEKPEAHVAGRYRPEERLLPVYLTPTTPWPDKSPLRIGSTLRQPATLFGL